MKKLISTSENGQKKSDKLKIIFSHYGTLDGGDACGFTRSYNLAKGLVSLGNEVVFLTTQKKGFKFPYHYENREGVDIYAFPEILPVSFRKGGLSFFALLIKIIFILFKEADIVHSDTGHRPSSGLPCIVHRFIYKSKYFSEWWEHFGKGGIYSDMPKWYRNTVGQIDLLFEERNRKNANGCVPISTTLYKRALRLGIDDSNLLILNGGADVDKIKFIKDNSEVKKLFGFSPDEFLIGLIGINDVEFINNLYLFKTLKKFVNSGVKIQVVATGNVSNEILEKYDFQNLEFIHIYNWLPYEEFTKLITTVDLFSLIQENTLRNRSRFPNKFGDYLATGRPIIANSVGELKEYFKKYPQAFYPINNNSNSIERGIEKAYIDWINRTLNYNEIREIAIKNSWHERAVQLNNFYLKICNNSHKN